MASEHYTLDDLQVDVFDLQRLLVATYDIVHEMDYVRNGKRDHELDRVASLLRIARDFAGRISAATDEHYHEIRSGRRPEPKADASDGASILRDLIAAFEHARSAYSTAAPEETDHPTWAAYEAAEHAIIVHPCLTLEEIQIKARFFLNNEAGYDTIRNCFTATEETLLPFLRSLLGEAKP